ncbi:MAG: hypothetical protein M3256_25310, partial [Actinomycetota bacterium]|nr:hypothetical protein [Actinomycetota bacterium]
MKRELRRQPELRSDGSEVVLDASLGDPPAALEGPQHLAPSDGTGAGVTISGISGIIPAFRKARKASPEGDFRVSGLCLAGGTDGTGGGIAR